VKIWFDREKPFSEGLAGPQESFAELSVATLTAPTAPGMNRIDETTF
jgi:hypothetical protein